MGTGLLQRLTTAEKVVALIVAIVTPTSTIWAGVASWQLNKLKEERTYSKTLFDQFEMIVKDEKASAETRAARLGALRLMTELLTDENTDLRREWATLISQQSGSYAALIAGKAEQKADPVAAIQVGQLRALQAQAAETAGADLSAYRVDVLWCESSGAAASAAAAAIVRQAPAGRTWQAKKFATANLRAPGWAIQGNSIRFDGDSELPAALALQAVVSRQPLGVGPFPTLRTTKNPTKNYLSVFVCPGVVSDDIRLKLAGSQGPPA